MSEVFRKNGYRRPTTSAASGNQVSANRRRSDRNSGCLRTRRGASIDVAQNMKEFDCGRKQNAPCEGLVTLVRYMKALYCRRRTCLGAIHHRCRSGSWPGRHYSPIIIEERRALPGRAVVAALAEILKAAEQHVF